MKKRDRQRERRGLGGYHDCELRVQCSLQHRRRGASALQFTFPVVRVCHLHSNVILVFLPCQWEQSSERVVCYRMKPPDYSFREHNSVYSERSQGSGQSGRTGQQIKPVSASSHQALNMKLLCVCVCMC